MAKRTTNRSSQDNAASAQDSGAAAPAQPKARRPRPMPSGGQPAPEQDTIAARGGIEGSENNRTGIPSEAGDDAPLESMSMGSEPSEEDIRLRAYHRYLER